ncbi:RNA polymerase subunit sigma-70 [Nocardia sp. BSTN01]|uniref:RNA polymerase subunit sigma-70 n=1 Tax=Nocardia sp. BSTN01 TaxID=2783665 RepID=UPI00188DF339|nr:RNA polymerase subunit sigma-70 [Nocardia sp. BSTN01]MBF5000396.1 RNA polymerase subunit sigma-70 [Nocardia sp. BSTN01]
MVVQGSETDSRISASAALPGDGAGFEALAQQHRAELHLHCYRFMGSTEDAEDLVQETFLRAWAKRDTYQGRSTYRSWLYGIATNACLDALRRRARRVIPADVKNAADPRAEPERATGFAWLEPYPEKLLESMATRDTGPEAKLIRKETTELAFIAAIQHLPPRQRAVLILRDVLDWSAKETAEALDTTPAAINSALRRARETIRQRWTPQAAGDEETSAMTDTDRSLLNNMVEAWEHADTAAVAALLSADARFMMPPIASWYRGRNAIVTFLTEHAFGPSEPGRFRALPTAANRQPALGIYIRDPQKVHRPFGLMVLTTKGTTVTEMALFQIPRLFPLAGLPHIAGGQ